jgi:hypothetical protein
VQVKASSTLVEEPGSEDATAMQAYKDAFLETISRYGLKPEALTKIWRQTLCA